MDVYTQNHSVNGKSWRIWYDTICKWRVFRMNWKCATFVVWETGMSYQVGKIVNFFLRLGRENEVDISPLKLQKLLYFSHGWYLALHRSGGPLLDEDIEAWKYGPVVVSVYQEFKHYRNSPIDRYVDNMQHFPSLSEEEANEIGPLLEKVWEVYGSVSAFKLSEVTHLPGTPWRKLYDRYGDNFPSDLIIDNDEIREHFKEKQRRSRDRCKSD